MKNKWFDESGFLIGKLPKNAIYDCTKSGSVDSSVKYWVQELRFAVPDRKMAETFLKSTGAYMPEELKRKSDFEINEIVFWLACCDVKESGEFLLQG